MSIVAAEPEAALFRHVAAAIVGIPHLQVGIIYCRGYFPPEKDHPRGLLLDVPPIVDAGVRQTSGHLSPST